MKKKLIKYFKSLGIEVYTNTKARGHQGFFLKNRIDVSKNTPEEKIIPTLLHEFTHFIHNKMESDVAKTGGSLKVIFNIDEIEEKVFFDELLRITNYVDENSLALKLKSHRKLVKDKILLHDKEIKKYYPNFQRSKKFKEFDKYIKRSKAKYLLKYDAVKFVTPFLRRIEVFSINNIEVDFPDMPTAFQAYLKLRSAQRKATRISARINKINKYYEKPTELFSRFVECLYLDEARAHALAPHCAKRFYELLDSGYYHELKIVFEMLKNDYVDIPKLNLCI